jgi:hypothetical protein
VDKLGAHKRGLICAPGGAGLERGQIKKKELIDIGLRVGFKGFGNFIQDGLKGHWTKNRGSIFCQSTAQKYIHIRMCTRVNPRHFKFSGFTNRNVILQKGIGIIHLEK